MSASKADSNLPPVSMDVRSCLLCFWVMILVSLRVYVLDSTGNGAIGLLSGCVWLYQYRYARLAVSKPKGVRLAVIDCNYLLVLVDSLKS